MTNSLLKTQDRDGSQCGFTFPGRFGEQWGLKNTGQPDAFGKMGKAGIDINITPAWELTMGSESVVIAVIDTGIDINHEDLKNSIYTNQGEIWGNGCDDDGNGYPDDINGWNFRNKDNIVFKTTLGDRHGTFVAGIIAANGDRGGITGVAPGVRILPLKFMDRNHGSMSGAIEAIEYAKAIGVKIVNCSWGDFVDSPELKEHMEKSGMLFICAAGNNGLDLGKKPFYPACFDLPNVLSVAAANNRGELWALSNYGESVHVAAPGVGILSTVPSSHERGYAIDSGTSLAVPHVTGIAALMMSLDCRLSPEDIKERIEQNVNPMPALCGKVKSGGMVDAYKAVSAVLK